MSQINQSKSKSRLDQVTQIKKQGKESLSPESCSIDKVRFNSSDYYRLEARCRFGDSSLTKLTVGENQLLSLVAQLVVWRKKAQAVEFLEQLPRDLHHMGYVILNSKRQTFVDQICRSDRSRYEFAKTYIDWAERYKAKIQAGTLR